MFLILKLECCVHDKKREQLLIQKHHFTFSDMLWPKLRLFTVDGLSDISIHIWHVGHTFLIEGSLLCQSFVDD
jgi:hypothetical protein